VSEPTEVRAPVPLLAPRDGVPAVVATQVELKRVVDTFAGARGPVAVDAERASGYRYGQRAYLVQLRRTGSGTALIDPIACPDLSALGAALAETEWVLHAAGQDLPSLAQLGMRPERLFDTELAGRLLGYPRVGLGTMAEAVLGYTLEKGHSAVDWSRRPLPDPWLSYAALDVEILVELRDALDAQLREQGKRRWADEEFTYLASAPAAPPRVDPWRRTSGLHRLRRPRQLAIVRSLWQRRDLVARQRDLSPRRVLPDAAIVEAALAAPASMAALGALPAFRGRGTRRLLDSWWAAVEEALSLPDAALPDRAIPGSGGPPPTRTWAERNPAAAKRHAAARVVVAALADEHRLPAENLLAPDIVRRLAWNPPENPTPPIVAAVLRSSAARPWQIELTATPLAKALVRIDVKSVDD
jgi:ribonuclease D